MLDVLLPNIRLGVAHSIFFSEWYESNIGGCSLPLPDILSTAGRLIKIDFKALEKPVRFFRRDI